MRQKFHIDFIKNSKIFFAISLGIMIVCLIVNIFVLPTRIDIQFTGGTILKYSYSGNLTENKVKDVAQKATKETISFTFSENLASSDSNSHLVSLEFTNSKAISVEEQDAVTEAFTEKYPKNNFKLEESSSVDASKGANFFYKCLAAVILAAVIIIAYVGIRFKKIGGLSAGVMAIIALVHDLIIVYFTFAMFNMSLDDNFIAVILMILGYSVNDTIVIYDRIRENRRKMGPKATTADVANASMNQCLTRTICTTITTMAAIGSILVVSLIYNIDSIISFALPMLIGLISGCYSSICIAIPLWVMWRNHSDKKKAEKAKAKKSETKKPESKKPGTKKSDSKKEDADKKKAAPAKKTKPAKVEVIEDDEDDEEEDAEDVEDEDINDVDDDEEAEAYEE